jgi:hypothetical protein
MRVNVIRAAVGLAVAATAATIAAQRLRAF